MRLSTIAYALAAGIFLTSSFDIFLNINAGPNLRVAQLSALLLILAALLTRRAGLALQLPLGAVPLLAWLAVQMAYIPVADFWEKSLAYCVWLAFNIALCFAMVNLFSKDAATLDHLLRFYLLSFVIMAGFGVVQFLLPVVGGPGIFVEQWWLPGQIPRVNGFSFEPSYFATYLIMGLVCLGSLRRSRVSEFRCFPWTVAYLGLILAMILCSSRIGLAFVLIELAITPALKLARLIGSPRRILHLRISWTKITAVCLAIGITIVSISHALDWVRDNEQTVAIVATGTGLLGTASHSIDEREDRLNGTLRTIADHPWTGQSLGGITESIAGYIGIKPMNFEESKTYEGQSVFAEVIASSGLLGSIPFFCFAIITLVAPLRLARRVPPTQAAWLRALAVSLVFEWGTLQFNQNILRLYLWVHVAVLATVYAQARHQYGEPGELESGGGLYASPNLLA